MATVKVRQLELGALSDSNITGKETWRLRRRSSYYVCSFGHTSMYLKV
jgi:hypothetical protein